MVQYALLKKYIIRTTEYEVRSARVAEDSDEDNFYKRVIVLTSHSESAAAAGATQAALHQP